HRKKLFGRQVVVPHIPHGDYEAFVRSEPEVTHAPAVFEKPVEEDRPRLTLERELDVRVGVRVEAGEGLQRKIAAHLVSASPLIGVLMERQPEHGTSIRLLHFGSPIASDSLLNGRRRRGITPREQPEGGEGKSEYADHQYFLHLSSPILRTQF